jgi:hypothetical protein
MRLMDRRSFARHLTAAGGLAFIDARAAAASAFSRQDPAQRAGFRMALSVSPFSEKVLESASLTDGKATASDVEDLQRLFNRHGATEVYQRIACRKYSPQNDAEHGWARGLERAALARSLGMPFNPEIGIFANYGDVSAYQEPPDFTDYPEISLPGPWISLTIDQMAAALRHYGALVARQILNTGVRVNFWDIGNEVELGVAGVTPRPLSSGEHYVVPDAVDPAIGRMTARDLFAMSEAERIAWCRAHLWPHTARLLRAVADGIRSVDPVAKFSTHISSANQITAVVPLAFWEAMRENGYLPDQLGQSVWGTQGVTHDGPEDTFAWLRDTASKVRRRFDRPMFLAEFGFPSGPMPAPFDWNDVQKGYPITDRGQHDYVRDVAHWGMRTGDISGIRPWAPDYCLGGWSSMSFFRKAGKRATAKPVLSAMQEGLSAARREIAR